ncbi:8243_t:CDS:1, partial [Acaulospora morrowiae]
HHFEFRTICTLAAKMQYEESPVSLKIFQKPPTCMTYNEIEFNEYTVLG